MYFHNQNISVIVYNTEEFSFFHKNAYQEFFA